MFGKTLGLLQLSSQTRRMNNRRTKAAAVLRKTAAKTGSQQLVALANLAKIAGFEKVKEAISTMIDELKVQQKDEVKHRDWCIEEFAENKKQTVLNQDTMEDLQAPPRPATKEARWPSARCCALPPWCGALRPCVRKVIAVRAIFFNTLRVTEDRKIVMCNISRIA